ncbi:MAG: hypothetical protein KGL39_32425 [Patescibacteria group bacterium]|nr:hypothetical protein [Patescibacteria group bacterium]
MSVDAKPVHEAVRQHLEDFSDRASTHGSELYSCYERAKECGKQELIALYGHDRESFVSHFGTYVAKLIHTLFTKISSGFVRSSSISAEAMGRAIAEEEAAKVYDNIAQAAGEVH